MSDDPAKDMSLSEELNVARPYYDEIRALITQIEAARPSYDHSDQTNPGKMPVFYAITDRTILTNLNREFLVLLGKFEVAETERVGTLIAVPVYPLLDLLRQNLQSLADQWSSFTHGLMAYMYSDHQRHGQAADTFRASCKLVEQGLSDRSQRAKAGKEDTIKRETSKRAQLAEEKGKAVDIGGEGLTSSQEDHEVLCGVIDKASSPSINQPHSYQSIIDLATRIKDFEDQVNSSFSCSDALSATHRRKSDDTTEEVIREAAKLKSQHVTLLAEVTAIEAREASKGLAEEVNRRGLFLDEKDRATLRRLLDQALIPSVEPSSHDNPSHQAIIDFDNRLTKYEKQVNDSLRAWDAYFHLPNTAADVVQEVKKDAGKLRDDYDGIIARVRLLEAREKSAGPYDCGHGKAIARLQEGIIFVMRQQINGGAEKEGTMGMLEEIKEVGVGGSTQAKTDTSPRLADVRLRGEVKELRDEMARMREEGGRDTLNYEAAISAQDRAIATLKEEISELHRTTTQSIAGLQAQIPTFNRSTSSTPLSTSRYIHRAGPYINSTFDPATETVDEDEERRVHWDDNTKHGFPGYANQPILPYHSDAIPLNANFR